MNLKNLQHPQESWKKWAIGTAKSIQQQSKHMEISPVKKPATRILPRRPYWAHLPSRERIIAVGVIAKLKIYIGEYPRATWASAASLRHHDRRLKLASPIPPSFTPDDRNAMAASRIWLSPIGFYSHSKHLATENRRVVSNSVSHSNPTSWMKPWWRYL